MIASAAGSLPLTLENVAVGFQKLREIDNLVSDISLTRAAVGTQTKISGPSVHTSESSDLRIAEMCFQVPILKMITKQKFKLHTIFDRAVLLTGPAVTLADKDS